MESPLATRLLGVTAAVFAFGGVIIAAQATPIGDIVDALTIRPTTATSPAVAAVGSLTAAPLTAVTPIPAVRPSEDIILPAKTPEANSAATAVDRDTLVGALVGFSGKSNQQRQTYIVETLFPQAGLTDIQVQSFPYSSPWGEEYGNWDGLHNVSAIRRGTLPDGQRKRIIVGGHYDKVTYPWRSATPGHSDGILDNGSGVAVLALLAREFPAPQNDLVFVGMATEEPPPYFNGSKAFFGQMSHDELAQTAAYVNIDVLGRGQLAAVVVSSPPLAAAAAVRVAGAGLPFARVPVSSNNNSDHLTAQAYGIPALALTCTGYSARDIHVPEDNLSVIDPETYFEHYRAARAALQAVDDHVAAETAAAVAQKAG